MNQQIHPLSMSNRKLSTEENDLFCKATPGESIRFLIFSDLDSQARYACDVLIVTDKKIHIFSKEQSRITETVPISDLKEVQVKRMYGNALLQIVLKDGTKKRILRFTYALTSLCEAAVSYLQSANSGGDMEEALTMMEGAFEKQECICPKCGRTLPSPTATCLACQSKRKLLNKLGKYIKPHTPILLFSLILSVITTVVSLLPPYITKTLVDDIIPNDDLRRLYGVVLLLFSAYVIHCALTAIRGYMLRVAGNKIIAALRNDIYEKAQYLTMKFYDKTSTGSVVNRISSDTATLQAFILRITQEVVVQFFLLIGIIVIMFGMNWKLTLISLLPVPLIVIGSRMFSKKVKPFYRRIWRRHAAITSVLTDTIPGIRVIKTFTNEKNATKTFQKYNKEWFKTDKKAAPVLTTYPAVINFLVNCGCLMIWLIGGKNVILGTGDLSTGLLVAFLSYVGIFYGPVNFFACLSDSYNGALAAAERIMDILDAEPEPNFGAGNIPDHIDGRIEFKNVNFAFDKSKKVLRNINLTIEKGDIVGIVGTTGSGKSTLINLILRFYDGYDGEILIDGKNLRDIDLQYFRSQIGYVQQEPMMFHDTIYNNIAYGTPDAHVEQILNAAEIANAHEFIVRQPDAYDSVLGERGIGLSGGEKQRISIARAVLKNPAILIFDEATAAVDSETEHLIQQAIERLIRGRTTLMIAHRLSTLSKANKIVVVDQGEIIECDTPEELLALKGKYYRLISMQSMASHSMEGNADLLN